MIYIRMNGPKSMYSLKPIIKLSKEIDLPKCMYNLKNIQHSYCNTVDINQENKLRSFSEQVKKFLKCPIPDVSALECRQEVILEQLAQLKDQMAKLKQELKHTKPAPSRTQKVDSSSTTFSIKKTDIIHDVVINANPNHPPYSILALKKLWGNSLKLQVNCHTHSSVQHLPDSVTAFSRNLSKEDSNKNTPVLNITLAWKNVGADPELVVSPLKHVVIRGEVNILRYFARLGPPSLNYEHNNDHAASSLVDSLLDVCHRVVHIKDGKERNVLLQVLASHLKQSGCATGDGSMSVVDIAAWSLFQQLGSILKKQCSSLSSWFERCSQILQISS